MPPDSVPDPEAGFSLIEVLAALAIATMLVIAAFQTLGVVTEVAAQRARLTAARELARVLLAEGATGQGATRGLTWRAVMEPVSPRLLRHSVTIASPRGQVLSVATLLLTEVPP